MIKKILGDNFMLEIMDVDEESFMIFIEDFAVSKVIGKSGLNAKIISTIFNKKVTIKKLSERENFVIEDVE